MSGQYKVVKDRFEVIDIETIEHGVHLIPCFKGFETSMATAKSPPALDVYREFFINNHVNIHMYNLYTSLDDERWEIEKFEGNLAKLGRLTISISDIGPVSFSAHLVIRSFIVISQLSKLSYSLATRSPNPNPNPNPRSRLLGQA